MAKFKLEITLGNDAMQTPADIADALTHLVNDIHHNTAGYPYEPITMGPSMVIAGGVRDPNGNCVGSWKVTR